MEVSLFGGLKLLELDVPEPDGLAFGLQGDVSVRKLEGRASGEKVFRWDYGSPGVKLWLLVAQDFLSVHAMNDLFIPPNLDFNLHPLIGRDGGGGGLHDVLGDELSIHFQISAGGANVAGGALAFAFVGEELKLKADGKALVESHALRRLRVNHDAAVEVHVTGSVFHHLSGKLVFHAENVVGVGEVGVEVAELTVEFRVFVVFAFQDAIFDSKGIEGIFAEGVFGDFGSPAGEVFSIKKSDPFRGVEGEGKRGGEKEFANHGRDHVILT